MVKWYVFYAVCMWLENRWKDRTAWLDAQLTQQDAQGMISSYIFLCHVLMKGLGLTVPPGHKLSFEI